MSKTKPVTDESEDENLNKAIEELRGVLRDEAEDGLSAAPGFVMSIPVEVQIVLGAAEMSVSELIALQKGSTVSLDRRIGEPVDVVVNGRRIARGEITLVENDPSRFGVRLTEIAGRTRAAE